jgi:hypothetical protein
MQIKTILNRIQKHRGFVYGAIQLEEQIGGLAVTVEIAPHRRNRPRCAGCAQSGRVPIVVAFTFVMGLGRRTRAASQRQRIVIVIAVAPVPVSGVARIACVIAVAQIEVHTPSAGQFRAVLLVSKMDSGGCSREARSSAQCQAWAVARSPVGHVGCPSS